MRSSLSRRRRWWRTLPNAPKCHLDSKKRFTLHGAAMVENIPLQAKIAQVRQQTQQATSYQAVIAIPVAAVASAPPLPTTNPSLGGYFFGR